MDDTAHLDDIMGRPADAIDEGYGSATRRPDDPALGRSGHVARQAQIAVVVDERAARIRVERRVRERLHCLGKD
jgi:hypothetical protein